MLRPGATLIHPHYMLMSGYLRSDLGRLYETLTDLQVDGVFGPLSGLAENIEADGTSFLAMQGSLGAAFEASGSYHMLARSRGMRDAIHAAGRRSRPLAEVVSVFYPLGR